MPMKNGNTVALERRMDLASLFCMIGRHGPAVVLAVVAMVSVLAAFVIYRTVRGKRRQARAAAAAAAADSDGRGRGEERGAVSRPEHEPRPEASLCSSDSTDVREEGSSDVGEDLIQSRPTIRLRRAAADVTDPPPRASPNLDRRGPSRSPTASHGAEVFREDHRGDENRDTDEVVSEKHNGRQEVNLPCDFNGPANFDRTREEGLRDTEPTPEINRPEQKLKEADMIDYNYCGSSNPLCPTVEKRESEDEVGLVEERDGAPASDVAERVVGEGCSTEVKAVSVDNHSAELQEDGRECTKEGGDLPVDQLEEQIPTSYVSTSDKECERSSLVPGSTRGDSSDLFVVPDASEALIPDVANSEEKEGDNAPALDNDTGLCALRPNLLSLEEEFQPCRAAASAENSPDLQHRHVQGQENVIAITAPGTYAVDHKSDANGTACGSTGDSCLNMPPVCQHQISGHVENNEAPSNTAPAMSKGGQQRGFSNTSGADPVLASVVNPPFCKMNLSLVQDELMEKDRDHTASPGVGVESGISSMTVSPDLQDACNEFDRAVDAMGLPADCDSQTANRTETQSSSDDAALSFVNKDAASLALEREQSVPSEKPLGENADWAERESFAANEDIYGNEVDESYQNAFDQFMARIAESVTSFTGELEKKADVKEVDEGREKRKGRVGSAQKKSQLEAEEEKEVDLEKTEISIMEATMDNNEWMTDSYQVLPWMNVSVPSCAQKTPKTSHVSTEENQLGSSLGGSSYRETDTTPSAEVRSSLAPSLVEENTENGKKVVAVQPMPQNVSVTFRIHYVTRSPYQTVAVTGNQRELGDWKEFIPLQRAKDGHWSTVVSLPAESHVEWKFVVLDKGEVCRWEECGNHLLDTGVGDDLIVHKWWGIV